MARATTLGVTATGAYGLLGLAQPAHAGGHMKSGGTLRMQMEVRALKDPRTYDWTQIAHSTAGYLDSQLCCELSESSRRFVDL